MNTKCRDIFNTVMCCIEADFNRRIMTASAFENSIHAKCLSKGRACEQVAVLRAESPLLRLESAVRGLGDLNGLVMVGYAEHGQWFRENFH